MKGFQAEETVLAVLGGGDVYGMCEKVAGSLLCMCNGVSVRMTGIESQKGACNQIIRGLISC